MRNDDIVYRDRLENTYVELLGSPPLRNQVRDELELASRPDLRAEPRPNTELIDIVASAPTPALAAQIADASAAALIERVRALGDRDVGVTDQIFADRIAELEEEIQADRQRLQETDGTNARARLADRIRAKEQTLAEQRAEFERNRLAATARASTLSLVSAAEEPAAPAGAGRVTYGALGLVAGLIGGIGLAFLVENLRPRIHSRESVESTTDIPVLAEIPEVSDSSTPLFNGGSGTEGAFALLRTNILACYETGTSPVVVFTSSESGHGKSTVVANLALSLAASNRSVVVVDADLRRPSIQSIFGLLGGAGLTDVLNRKLLPTDAIKSTHTPFLYAVTAGSSPHDPAALLGSGGDGRDAQRAAAALRRRAGRCAGPGRARCAGDRPIGEGCRARRPQRSQRPAGATRDARPHEPRSAPAFSVSS